MNKKISVLLYCENQDSVMRNCLNSLMRQSYDDLEVIIIDDSVSSKEEKIYNDVSFSPLNCMVIQHSEKTGFYQSISEGLKAADGEYISILDNKISLSVDFFRTLYTRITETDSDIAFADVGKKSNTKKYYYNLDALRNFDFNPDSTAISGMIDSQGMVIGFSSLHNKLFRKTVICKAFENIYISDETAILYHLYVILKIFSYSKKVCNIHNVITFFDDSFYPVDLGLDAKNESKTLQLIYNEISFTDKEREQSSAFILSYFISVFFFHKCFYEEKIKSFMEEIFAISGNTATLYYNKTLRVFSLITDYSEAFNLYENIKSFICRPDVKYFGFDIFDTLVLRPFFEPTDLFVLLNKKFCELISEDTCIDFSVIRKEGEAACRQYYSVVRPCNEDVSLVEIYNFISDQYGIEKSITDKLLEYEEQLELYFIQPRQTGKDFFDLAQYKKKYVFIASDMYLSEEQINKMLEKCGYSKYKLYLSNALGVSKYSGNLYKYILDDFGITDKNEKIGFIGDNYNVDVVNSQKYGFISFHFPKTTEIFMNANLAIFSGDYYKHMFTADGGIVDLNTVLKFSGIRAMLAIVANKMFDNPYISFNQCSDFNSDPRFIGYFACGMFLYGESKWIFDRVNREGVKTVHFVSRDGFFFKKAFDIINDKKKGATQSNYLYLSRKAIVPLYMQNEKSLLEAYLPPHAIRQSPESIINIMRPVLNDDIIENAEKICNQGGFAYKKTFSNLHQYYSFAAFFASDIYDKESYVKYVNMVKPYFAGQIHPDDVLFDVGYSGRGEKILSSILEFPVNSMYFHTHEPMALARKNKMGFEIETFYSFKPASAFVTREQIFTPNTPSCIGFTNDGGKCVPMFEHKNKDSFIGTYLVSVIQEYAVKFVDDFIHIFGDYDEITTINCFDSCYPLEYYLHYARDFDRQIFSFVDFEDDFGMNQILNVKDYWDKESKDYKCNTHFMSRDQNLDKTETTNSIGMISMDDFNQALNGIYKSWTWRTGKFILTVPSAVKRRFQRRKKNDSN